MRECTGGASDGPRRAAQGIVELDLGYCALLTGEGLGAICAPLEGPRAAEEAEADPALEGSAASSVADGDPAAAGAGAEPVSEPPVETAPETAHVPEAPVLPVWPLRALCLEGCAGLTSE